MVHLHARSCYSLLESSLTIEQLVERSAQLGFRHVALTDKNVMYGTMKFYKTCMDHKIHPILGLEIDALFETGKTSFVFLAKNDQGLQDLYALSTLKMSHNHELSMADLSSYSQNCIVLTTGIQEEDILYNWILHEDQPSLYRYFETCRSSFSSFYIGILCNDSGFWKEKNKLIKKIANETGLLTCALSYILYQKKEDVLQLRTLKAIQKQARIHDQDLVVLNDRFIRSHSEMESLYDPEDLIRTDEIAQMCNVQMAMPKSSLPSYQNKLGIDSKEFLIKLCKAGLAKRLSNHWNEEYAKRLEYECSTIIKMGFTDYFLIVYDFIRFARSKDINVGPGRGSAAGSLVAYCLGITHIDPIKNHLLFERFLNPERISMPDIDTDFPDDRRDEVIDYVKERYGKDHVSHIVTFNTLKAKQVLRDVGRVYSISSAKIDQLTKLIPNTPGMTLKRAFSEVDAFSRILKKDKTLMELYQYCLPLEGLPRHLSIHAAGIVLSDQPIVKVCPLVQIDESHLATQFTMEYLEELGLIKMDFLGLRNLTTIDHIVKTIEQQTDHKIDVLKLPLNDQKTYRLLSKADTTGVFQLESQGIRALLKRMKPSRFEEICAVLALYRPGAMQNIDAYIQRKEHPKQIEYPHPLTQDILKETYGLIIYQEQVMQIATKVGGLSLAQADSLRKAMSKKKHDQMAAYKETFVQGALKNHCSYKQAVELFDTMEKFASYGFNKSHSYAYGLIAYQMAYLKANYPLYFYQNLFDSVIGSEKKTSQYLSECRSRKLVVYAPDINRSEGHYTIEEKGLRMPFQVLKGIGSTIYPPILEERRHGQFQNFIECVVRLSSAHVIESSLRILIDGGVFDSFGLNRATMHDNLARILVYADLVKTEVDGQIRFDFSVVSKPSLRKMKENPMERSQKEFRVYGFYLSEHPVKRIRETQYPKCLPLSQAESYSGYLNVIGRVVGYRVHKTKQGQNMCFMSIDDESGKIDITLMPELYAKEKDNIQKEHVVLVQGNKNRPNSILARKCFWLNPEKT